ncbi:acyl-CoA N-acyltransferase [Paraphoma chrysanthemicola]|uniref:Acyl-CoA N-acyltransferase n=1 Tax=Paraphoma chrysanthemicola TaxID=798071 RepID=A0A8K0VT82_9PLEO|nr:acyl-CoA N-acyltransferase [Paraphoma chrysanthemicola]
MAQPSETPTTVSAAQEAPVEPRDRIPNDDLKLEFCTDDDAQRIAEILYICFPQSFWDRKEPPSLSSIPVSERIRRMAKRVTPSLRFQQKEQKWIKAIYVPTGEIAGIACWTAPGAPLHIFFRRSANEVYGWQEKMNWTDTEIDEMWEHVSDEAWNGTCEKDDANRREILGDEPHWHLAPLATLPQFQGKGVGGMLLKWAFEQADCTEPPTPLYLESAPTARRVYLRYGFVPCGEINMIRRGPGNGEEQKGKTEVKEKEVGVKA